MEKNKKYKHQGNNVYLEDYKLSNSEKAKIREMNYKSSTKKINTAYNDTFPLRLKDKCKSKKGCY